MKKVVIYTLSTCPWCKKAEKYFEDRDIPYENIDYDLAEESEQERMMEEMERAAGRAAMPFVKIDDKVVVGYKPEKYSELLGIE